MGKRAFAFAQHSLVQNTFAMAMVQAGTNFVPLITIPYVARTLGVSGWGLVAFAQSFGTYLFVVGEYGFVFSATREVARHRDNNEKLGDIVAGVLGARVLLSIAVVLVGIVVHWWIPIFKNYPVLLWSGVFWALARSFSMVWYFQGRERMKLVAWLDIIAQTLAAICIFILVRTATDGWKVLALQGLGFLASFAVGLGLTYREVPIRLPGWKQSWEALRMGWSLFLFRGSVSLYTTGNAFILGLFVAPTWVGYYAGAEKISKAFLGLLSPVSQALYPRLSHLVYHARERAVRLARVAIAAMGMGGAVLGILVFALAPTLVRVILGPGYSPAVTVLRILALLPPLVALSTVYGVQWMLPLGMERSFNKIILTAGAINIGIAVFLAPSYFAVGMACAVVTAEMFVTGSIYILLRRRKLDPMSFCAVPFEEIL